VYVHRRSQVEECCNATGIIQERFSDDNGSVVAVVVAAAANDDDEDDDEDESHVDELAVNSRPDRPDCVPRIDLSWITDDELHRTTHAQFRNATTHSISFLTVGLIKSRPPVAYPVVLLTLVDARD